MNKPETEPYIVEGRREGRRQNSYRATTFGAGMERDLHCHRRRLRAIHRFAISALQRLAGPTHLKLRPATPAIATIVGRDARRAVDDRHVP